MRKIIGLFAYPGYLTAGWALTAAAPGVGFSPFASAMLGLAFATACIAAHLIVLSARRATRLASLLDCQDDLLRQIVDRLDRAETRADSAEARLGTLGDVKGTLRDVAAMLAMRAAADRPALARAA